MTTDVLFILKKRPADLSWTDVYTDNCGEFSSGLYNSVKFLIPMLNSFKIPSAMVEVIDNNGIDAVVTKLKPKVVIIEALWVVPEKFKVLAKLHPNVKWVIRIHSEVPFLAQEGIAVGWLDEYGRMPNVIVAANNKRIFDSIYSCMNSTCIYLPNFYQMSNNYSRKRINQYDGTIDISCFGAIRPMKNHLQQAIAAIKFADGLGKKLRFHINSTRKELNGDPVLKNMESLFHANPEHTLVKAKWMSHDNFIDYINRNIDIGMQVSYSETFNIVAADHVDAGVPVVSSDEVKFIFDWWQADPNDTNDIVEKLHSAYNSKTHYTINKLLLNYSNRETKQAWLKELFILGV